MLWPSPADYAQAVKDFPHVCLLDPGLRGGKPHRGTNNVLLVYSGGFSTVFRIEVTPTIYALRCWIKDVGDAKKRYEAISDCLKQVGLPYFVDFEYVSDGILINGKRYPITRMEWAEGETLRDFIEQNLQDANILKTAAQEFRQMFETLHAHHIAHGDLQDGNILLKRNGNQVEIKLIDYDSLYVPALRGQSSPTPGLPEYQHPTRGAQLAENVDYFSELVIYLSFLSLSENPSLWAQFKGRSERGLLFSKADFENPTHSDVFHELEKLSTDVQQLALTLKNFCAKTSIDQLSPLEDILPKSPPIPPEEQYYNLGMTYRKSQQYPQAIAEFQKAIGLNPDFKEAYHALGLTYLQIGKLDEARKAADAALVIDPTYSFAQQLLDAIGPKPVTPPTPSPAPPKSPSAASTSPQVTPQPTPSNLPFNIWQVVAGGLGAALIICAVVLGTQMQVKEEAFHQVAELTSQLEQKKSEFQGATSRVKSLENDKATLIREIRTLRTELEEQEKVWENIVSEKVVKLQNQLDWQKKELASQESENRNLQSQLAEKNSEIRAQVSIANRLRDEKAGLVVENQDLQNQLSGSVAEAKKQSTIVQQLHSERAKALRENENLRRDNATRTSENRKLRRENTTRTSKNRKLQSDNAALESEVKSLKSEVERLRNLKIDRFLLAPVLKTSGWNRINPRPKYRKRTEDNNRGFIAFNNRRYSEAITHFSAAIRTDSKFATAHYNLGCAYLKRKQYDRAVDSFRKSIALNSEFKEASYNLALAHFGTGNRNLAKVSAKSALQIDENYLLARAFLKAIE